MNILRHAREWQQLINNLFIAFSRIKHVMKPPCWSWKRKSGTGRL